MTFYDWLNMEYLDPMPGDNYHERDMIAAWNQAVACCRKEVRNMIGNNAKHELLAIFHKLETFYYRGEDDGH